MSRQAERYEEIWPCEEGADRQYATNEQRRSAGSSGGRMYVSFCNEVLEPFDTYDRDDHEL